MVVGVGILMFLVGLFCGLFFTCTAQAGIEAKYAKRGIAKLDGDFYRITRIDVSEGDRHDS